MKFELLTLTGTKFSGDVNEVTLTTASGQMGILPGHEPLTAIVVGGPVIVRHGKGEPEVFATFGGLLEVRLDGVRLLADEAEHADDLVQADVEAALAKAEKIKASTTERRELARAQDMLDRNAVRLGVVKLRSRHRGRSR